MKFNSGLILVGLLLLTAPAVVPAPEGMSDLAWRASGLASTMALWWISEALPLPATALLPVAVAPMMGLTEISDAARSYSDPLIFLFLGGFLVAKAIEKSGLDKRLAGVLLRQAGSSSHKILWSFMLCTAFLSLWISNTASAMVVAPIAAAVAGSQGDTPRFGTTLMLGIAFSATIGGMGSLIGTPPNAIFAAYVRTTHGVDVGFAQWAAIGIPVAFALLLVTWITLTQVSPRLPSLALRLTDGPPEAAVQEAERRVAVIAGLTALAWVSRPLIQGVLPMVAISDAGISIVAALTLFMMSDGKDGRLLDWDAAASLRWDVLILFGGGLALASVIQQSGLADWIGGSVQLISDWPQFVILFFIAALVVYLGELASNTAMAAIFLPIAGAVATGLGADPVAFMLPIAMAASIGFMLPVATPPNAIVFADPAVTRSDMLRAGAPLDVIALFITVGATSVLGVDCSEIVGSKKSTKWSIERKWDRPMKQLLLIAAYLVAVTLPLILSWLVGGAPRTFHQDLASGLGILAFSMILMEFVLSGRFKSISNGVGMDVTMRFHQVMARTALVFALLHPFLYQGTPSGGQRPWDPTRQLTITTDFSALSTGIAAYLLLPSLVLLAIGRTQLDYKYETWRLIHGIGALLIALLLLHHTVYAGRYGSQPVMVWVWLAMTGVSVGSLLYVYLLVPFLDKARPWRVASVTQLTPKQWEVTVKPEGHSGLDYKAGQFVWLNLGHSSFSMKENPFSICSAPADGPEISFMIKELGDFTRTIGQIESGTVAYLDGPYGNLSVDGRTEPGVALIAGGVGLAPLLGILRQMRLTRDPRKVRLIYGNRMVDQIAYRDELGAQDVFFVLSDPPENWHGETGFIDSALIDRFFSAKEVVEWVFVMCGPAIMMDIVENHLIERGAPSYRILSERFDYD